MFAHEHGSCPFLRVYVSINPAVEDSGGSGEKGSGSDETEVTGIDHCWSGQAKSPSSLCALESILGEEGRQLQSMSHRPLRASGSVWICLSFLFLTDSSEIEYVSKQIKKPKT